MKVSSIDARVRVLNVALAEGEVDVSFAEVAEGVKLALSGCVIINVVNGAVVEDPDHYPVKDRDTFLIVLRCDLEPPAAWTVDTAVVSDQSEASGTPVVEESVSPAITTANAAGGQQTGMPGSESGTDRCSCS